VAGVGAQFYSLDKATYILHDNIGHLNLCELKIRSFAASEEWKDLTEKDAGLKDRCVVMARCVAPLLLLLLLLCCCCVVQVPLGDRRLQVETACGG